MDILSAGSELRQYLSHWLLLYNSRSMEAKHEIILKKSFLVPVLLCAAAVTYVTIKTKRSNRNYA